MKVFVSGRRGPSPMSLRMQQDRVLPWGEGDRSQIQIGASEVYFRTTDYSTEGISLSETDLVELLEALRQRRT